MEKVLNQQEIDALVKAARGSSGLSSSIVTAWDYTQAGKIGGEQLDAISALHEGFARNLTNSIGAYLRIGFQTGLVSAEHLSYREFLGGIPERSYLGSIKLAPIGIAALIQIDLAVAFPLIDVLLGGEGIGQAPSREITEIEEQILETVMRIICRELENVWQPLGLQFQFEGRQHANRVQHLLPVDEKTLGLSFEVTMKDARGLMSIAVPAVVSTALLRKISSARPRSHAQFGSADSVETLRRRLLGCPFRLELELELTAPSASLASLTAGDVLLFKRRAEGVAELVAKGRPVFQARVARLGNSRAAQILASTKDQLPWKEYDDKSC